MSKMALRFALLAIAAALFYFSVERSALAAPPLSLVTSQEGSDLILVRVGSGEVIRASDVRSYAQRRADLRALLNSPTGWGTLVDEIAMTRSLVLEGERRQERRTSNLDSNVDSRFDDVYALAVYRKIVGECKAPADDVEARQYYDVHPQAFQLPAQAQIKRIVLPKNAIVDKFPAEQWLGLQARAVAMSNARFDALIKRAAEAAPDLRQGDLGWVRLEGVEHQPVLGAIQSAGKGGLVGPLVEGEYVYLLQVTDWRDAQLLPWDMVKHQVPTRAVQYCRETQRERVKVELFQRYEIQIDDKALRAMGATRN